MLKIRTLSVASIVLLANSASAQANAPTRLQVHCVDVDGKQVAGAEVHVFQNRRMPDGSGTMIGNGPFTSGADGIAETATAIDYDGGKFDRWAYVRVAGKMVGALRQARFDDSPADAKLIVTLYPSRELRGRVKVPDGVRPEAVRIRVRTLSQIVGTNLWGQVYPRQLGIASLENVLPERFECQVAKDGCFVLSDMPSKPFLLLAATGDGLAQVLWSNALLPERSVPEMIELDVTAESRFGGVLTDARSLPVVDASVELRISSEARGPATAMFLANTDKSGLFKLSGLPAGPFELSVRSQAGVMRPQRINLAKAESKLDAKVELEDGEEVAGVVVVRGGEAPLADVSVMAITTDNLQLNLGNSRTDLQGRFHMRLPSGPAKLYFGGVPRGFVYPNPQILTTIDVKSDDKQLQKLRFEIERAQ